MSKPRRIDPAAPTTDHLVIDIETLGTNPGCEIRSIGAAAVWMGGNPLQFYMMPGCGFYRLSDNSTLYRGKVDMDSWEFWHSRKVSQRAFRHAFAPRNRIPVDEALAHLTKRISGLRIPGRDLLIWGNGPEFDISILEYAYRTTGQDIPWQYWEVRDIRTATSLHPVTVRRRTTKHHAQLDAEHDGKMLAMVLNGMRRQRIMLGGSRTSKTEHALDACRMHFPPPGPGMPIPDRITPTSIHFQATHP